MNPTRPRRGHRVPLYTLPGDAAQQCSNGATHNRTRIDGGQTRTNATQTTHDARMSATLPYPRAKLSSGVSQEATTLTHATANAQHGWARFQTPDRGHWTLPTGLHGISGSSTSGLGHGSRCHLGTDRPHTCARMAMKWPVTLKHTTCWTSQRERECTTATPNSKNAACAHPSRDRCNGSCGLPPHSRVVMCSPCQHSWCGVLALALPPHSQALSLRAPSPQAGSLPLGSGSTHWLGAHSWLAHCSRVAHAAAPSPLLGVLSRRHPPHSGLTTLSRQGSPPNSGHPLPSPHASGGCPLARARVEQSATAKGMGGWETLTGQPQQARATRLHTKARSATATRLAKVQQNPKDRHTQTHDSKARAARRAKTRCGADSLPASRTSSRTSSPRSEAYRAKNTNTRRTDSPKNANPNKARRRRRAGSSDLPGGTR